MPLGGNQMEAEGKRCLNVWSIFVGVAEEDIEYLIYWEKMIKLYY